MNKTYLCPVCGFHLRYPPADFNICPSCGTEFGYSDSGRTYEELRQNWLWHGARWASTVEKPPRNWDALLQLNNLGFPFAARADISPSVTFQWASVPFRVRT